MWTFLTGLLVAVALTAGTAIVYRAADVTMVERSSPAAWVRVDDEASRQTRRVEDGEELEEQKHVRR